MAKNLLENIEKMSEYGLNWLLESIGNNGNSVEPLNEEKLNWFDIVNIRKVLIDFYGNDYRRVDTWLPLPLNKFQRLSSDLNYHKKNKLKMY